MNKRTFHAADYAVFGLLLGVSAFIGIFYAIKERTSKSGVEEYFLASRSMGVFPVATSLTVSFLSAITVLATPSEVYFYGTMFWWMVVVFFLVAIIVSQIYIPTFYNLGIASTYEYLELRFSRPVRILGTLTYLAQNIMYIGIVIYAPALALNEVTGFGLWMAVLSTGLVCTVYTTLGGLKAVLWSDVFQGFVMFGGFIAAIARGSMIQGGFAKVWEICEEGGRIDFVHFETDMRVRHTFWSIMTGGLITWVGLYGVNQSQVQRYLCCRSAKKATQALFLNVFGLFIIVGLACMTGLVIYARYAKCDPLKQGCIKAPDQIFPYLVMDILHDYPGVPGLFISCVFSGSLSTISSGINAMATVTIEDFIKPATRWQERTYSWISKGLVVFYGLASIGMAALASSLGEILQAAYSILGMVGGPLVGLFTLGMLTPFANSIGGSVGLVCGIAVTTWIYLGSKVYKTAPEFIRRLNVTTIGCTSACYFEEHDFNSTTPSTEVTTFTAAHGTTEVYSTAGTTDSNMIGEKPMIAEFYSISYLYATFIGMACTIIVGIILSLLTCGWRHRKEVDPNLLSPIFDHYIFKCLPKKVRYILRCCVEEKPERNDADVGQTGDATSHSEEIQLSSVSLAMRKKDDMPKKETYRVIEY